jgi:hypothetical protein
MRSVCCVDCRCRHERNNEVNYSEKQAITRSSVSAVRRVIQEMKTIRSIKGLT